MAQDHLEKPALSEEASPAPTPQISDADSANGEKPAGVGQNDIPLGGTKAWLQVLGGFFAFINIWYAACS